MRALIGATSAQLPTPFDWLTGFWMPIIFGSASLVVTLVALILSLVANRTAGLALAVTRDAAGREARMPRERVAHTAIMALNTAMNDRWAKDEDFELRVVPTMNELVQAAGAEGVDPASIQQLIRWLSREAGAVASMTTSDPTRFREMPSNRMGMLALRLSFGLRIDEWVKTEHITETATVANEQAEILKPLPSS